VSYHGVEAVFSNTEKPLYFPHEGTEVTQAVINIAKTVTGYDDLSKKPVMVFQLSPTSPLSWVESAVDSLIYGAKAGIPCSITCQPLSGMTAPFTVAGQLIMNNAEVVSGMVITQLVNPGNPNVYGQAWVTFDMMKSFVLFTSPEAMLLRIAGDQMAKFYKVPSMMCGSDTESWTMDIQNGMDKGLSASVAYSVGANFIADFGQIASCTMASCEQLLIDSEVFEIVSRLKSGIEVNENTKALDVIDKVGSGGNYLREQHTLDHLRTDEYYKPSLFSPDTYETWTSMGSPDLSKKAHDRVEEILAAHKPKELSGDKKQKVKDIIVDFEERIG